MSEYPHRIAVVGASLAGAHATRTLRKLGYDGEIVLFGDEPHHPYDRPPLSKALLGGSRTADEIALRFFSPDGLTLRLGRTVTSLDARARTVGVDGCDPEGFEGIVLATGSVPVMLDAEVFPAVHYLRGLDDALDLRARLTPGARLVIIGAGLIGCEVAATARGQGVDVTLVDPFEPCQQSMGAAMAQVLRKLHTANGVEFRCGVSARGVHGSTVYLTDGGELRADVVLVAVGARPATSWLAGSGLDIDDGVICDESCLAAPGVVAAGDVARWTHPDGRDGSVRLEHWNNAVEQSRHATKTLLANLAGFAGDPYLPRPWFWSEQYGHRIQVAGWVRPEYSLNLLDGSLEESKFFAEYRQGDRTTGAVGFDSAKRFGSWLDQTYPVG